MTNPVIGMPQAWSRVARQYQRYIAPDFLPAARRLCRAVGIGRGDIVLDVACGPGTAALAAQELGARRVVGIDYAHDMVAVAREEARGAPELRFAVGDAIALPVASERFDVVVSSFGLIFAPDPPLAAAESARVLRPGGRLGLLVWPPEGSVGDYQQAAFRHLAVPPGAHDPFQWGVPARARGWLGGGFVGVEQTPLEVPFEAASAADAWRVLRTATGRVAAAYGTLDEPARARLDAEMERFFEPFRRPDGRVYWPREAFVVRGIRA